MITRCFIFAIKMFGKQGNKKDYAGKVFNAAIATIFLMAFASYFQNNSVEPHSFILFLKLLVILQIIITLHELGHYAVARFYGVSVPVFSVGLGKHLYSFQKWGTTFQLASLPFGGYVKPDPKELEEKMSLIGKCLFLLAGIIVNLTTSLISLGIYSMGENSTFISGVIRGLKGIEYMYVKTYIALTNIRLDDVITPKGDIEGNIDSYFQLSQFTENFWYGFAALSIFLAILNSIPIPILDGGRVVLAILSSILNVIRVPANIIKVIVASLLWMGLLIYFAPILINTVWSSSLQAGMTPFEYILWVLLAVTVVMNVTIFINNRRLTS
jgi:Zn-dependent protease